jgi:cytoskeleton protein RodZ
MTKVTHLTLDERGSAKEPRIHLREISGDADAPLGTVGQDLREARLRRGDDLASVSRVLRIRKDHLEALEEDRLEALPGRTYAIGFVRSYADYLGLDAPACVDRFKIENAGRSDGSPQVGVAPPDPDERRLPHGWIVMALVILAIVVYGGYHLMQSADTLLKQPVAPVPARIAAVPANNPPRALVVHRAPSVAASPLPGAGTPAANAPNAVPPAVAPGGAQPATLPQGQTFGLQNKGARVVLLVRAVTHVLVQGPGGRVYVNRVLHPGDSYRVPDVVGLTLTTPDGGAVGLELDGQEMGAAGPQGQMTEALSLNPQSVVDHHNTGHAG